MFSRHSNHNGKVKKLPKAIREYMTQRFDLVIEYLDTLRCFEYYGVVNDKEVSCIRIFNPYSAREQFLNIGTRADLERHPEAVLFEGHIDRQGNVYVADRRPPLRLVNRDRVNLAQEGV